MLRWMCVFLLITNYGSGFLEDFIQKDPTPKCCNLNEILSNSAENNFTTIECVGDRNKTLQVLKKQTLYNFSLDVSETCMDIFVDTELSQAGVVKIDPDGNVSKINLNKFPKCCPFGFQYDLQQHSCTEAETTFFNSFNDSWFLVNAGLSDCTKVIADHELVNGIRLSQNQELILETETIPYGSYCIDEIYKSNSYVTRVCHSNFDICKKRNSNTSKLKCIKKCCPDGQMYIGGAKCKYNFNNGISFYNDSKVINPEERFHVVQGHSCRQYIVPLDWNYTLTEYGNIEIHDIHDVFTPFQPKGYCFENVNFGINQGRRLFLCFKVDPTTVGFQVSRVALILSSVFLILTLLGYSILPEMRNLHGKTLMCHCFSLLVAFVTLAIVQFYPTVTETYACETVGYFIMYTFLAAFMWSNIMCFDIWWTFGCMRIQGINYKKKELKRFMWYCLYAWGIPVILTGITFSVQQFGHYFPESLAEIVPALGGYNCFFEQQTNTVAFLVWFILPIAIVLICNSILFLKTIIYCYKVKGDIEKMKDTQAAKNERKKVLMADKEKLKFALKLFLVMGISWICEVISACAILANPTGIISTIILICDTFDCLQGVFIFCVFILKRKFIHALKKKIGMKYIRRASQSTTGVATMSTYLPVSSKH